MMSRKDYEAIAAAIRVEMLVAEDFDEEAGTWVGRNAIVALAERLASILAGDNPRFDRERFLKAAGVA